MTPARALSLPFRATPVPGRSASTRSGPRPRFSLDGSPELEDHLHRTCAQITAGLRGLLPSRKLEAVLLGGGYGRGEGGVWRTAVGDRPYNDLEFYVCLRGNRHLSEQLYGRELHVLGEILTPQAGLDVEFKITSLDEIRSSAVSMFSYDLVCGHHWMIGHEDLLEGCWHHRDASRIPLSEATRLLMNRCSGLLFAQALLARMDFSPSDSDFTARNLAKAELALGDALLVSLGEYHWSVRERHRRLWRLERQELPDAWLREVCRRHARGVQFKLHPERSDATRESLLREHAAVRDLAWQTWQWLESRRLGATYDNPIHYASSADDKMPGSSAVRNVFVNLKTRGLAAAWRPERPRHPRDRVLRAMALLLWEPATLATPSLLARVQAELGTRATNFPELVGAYRNLWSRVS